MGKHAPVAGRKPQEAGESETGPWLIVCLTDESCGGCYLFVCLLDIILLSAINSRECLPAMSKRLFL